MTSSTKSTVVIVLGDTDTGTRSEMLDERAAECGVLIAETYTFPAGEAIARDDLSDLDAVVTALSRAICTHLNVWVPFPIDFVREEHLRRLSLVLQRHGLDLLVGKNLWNCPPDGGINAIDVALRREVHAVDELDNAAMAAAGAVTLCDEIQAALGEQFNRTSRNEHGRDCQLSEALRQLEVQYGPHPGMPATRMTWSERKPGLTRFARWLVHQCGMTRVEAATFLNSWGHRTKTGRPWSRSTVATLVRPEKKDRPVVESSGGTSSAA
ncbi:hypothetical protein [Mycobacterium sp. M26]|uniref:hypothetical protein n=1 Tax=Mycobacterium sp. M26 TaxID=1762962 RepID=UPI00073F8B67|nr:hypothetical protein [Mycobacterium sp. M26]